MDRELYSLVLDFLRYGDAFAGGKCKRCGFWLDDDEQRSPAMSPAMPMWGPNPRTQGPLNRRQSNPGRGVRLIENFLTSVVEVQCRGCRVMTRITMEQLDDFERRRLSPPVTWTVNSECRHCGRQLFAKSLMALGTYHECTEITTEFGRIVRVVWNAPLLIT